MTKSSATASTRRLTGADEVPLLVMLRGEQVVLAPLMAEDSETLLRWIREHDVMILSSPYRPVSEALHRAWFETTQKWDDVVIFAIRLAANDELIGTCQLTSIDDVHRSAEVRIRIGPGDRRGHGYGSEAVRLLSRFAFDDLNLHRIYLYVFATNAIALRAYEKVGFVREGTLRDGAFIEGRYVDVVAMGMLRGELLSAHDPAN
jgi:diamine N-acetyltransferase